MDGAGGGRARARARPLQRPAPLGRRHLAEDALDHPAQPRARRLRHPHRDPDQPAAGRVRADRPRQQPARAGARAGGMDGGERRPHRGGAAGLRGSGEPARADAAAARVTPHCRDRDSPKQDSAIPTCGATPADGLSAHVQARRQSGRPVQEGARRGDAGDGRRARAQRRLLGRSAGLLGRHHAAAAGDAAADARRGAAGARHRRRLRAQAALPRRRHAPALCPRGRDRGGAVRGDGDGALRGDGGAGDAGDGGQHRRQDRRRGAARRLCRDHRPGPGAAGAGGRLPGAAARDRAEAAGRGGERARTVARASRRPGGRNLRRARRGARRPAGLRPLRPAGDRGPRLRRPARRGSGRRRRRDRGRGGRGEPRRAGGGRRRRGRHQRGGRRRRRGHRRARRPGGPAGGDRHRRGRRRGRGDGRRGQRAARAQAAGALVGGRPGLQGLHRPSSTRRSPPRTSPTRSSSSGSAPISTSSSSR